MRSLRPCAGKDSSLPEPLSATANPRLVLPPGLVDDRQGRIQTGRGRKGQLFSAAPGVRKPLRLPWPGFQANSSASKLGL